MQSRLGGQKCWVSPRSAIRPSGGECKNLLGTTQLWSSEMGLVLIHSHPLLQNRYIYSPRTPWHPTKRRSIPSVLRLRSIYTKRMFWSVITWWARNLCSTSRPSRPLNQYLLRWKIIVRNHGSGWNSKQKLCRNELCWVRYSTIFIRFKLERPLWSRTTFQNACMSFKAYVLVSGNHSIPKSQMMKLWHRQVSTC